MPFRKRAPKRPRRRVMAKSMPYRPRALRSNPQPVFTETWDAGQLTVPLTGTLSGGFNMSFTSLPQAAQYRNLYRQFRILRNTWVLVPRFNSVDPNSASATGYTQGRIAYAINDTAGQTNPANELAVLQSNGAKLAQTATGKILRLSHIPVSVQDVGINSIVPQNAYVNKKRVWFNTANPNNTGSGEGVLHGFIAWFITVPSLAPQPQIVYDVYCKTTVQFKDPA